MGGNQYSEEAVSRAFAASKGTLALIIRGLDIEDAKQLAKVVWEIAEKNPTGNYSCIIQGLEDKPLEEAKRIFREIFPIGGMAS